MSVRAIAAVRARDDLSTPERLTCLALVSYANPAGTFTVVRDAVADRGLLAFAAGGERRGGAGEVELVFAREVSWWDGRVIARLVEMVLAGGDDGVA